MSTMVGRQDLRDLEFFTIDPGDARDFDDAVCVSEQAHGWQLHVAVADVSHYVQAGSVTDGAAAARALSVYLPDRAIHMLPEALSTGICSLAPRTGSPLSVVSFRVPFVCIVATSQEHRRPRVGVDRRSKGLANNAQPYHGRSRVQAGFGHDRRHRVQGDTF